MIRYGVLGALLALPVPGPMLGQTWTAEADLQFSSHYEWRGLQLDPGSNAQYSVYGSVAWDDLILTAGVWSITDLSVASTVGLPERWAFETSPWVEGSIGGSAAHVMAGVIGYMFRNEPTVALRRGSSWEVYAGGRSAMPGAPLLGEATLYWDMGRVGGAYAEVATTLQIPVWTGIVVPIGSIFLGVRSGFSLGQDRDVRDSDPADYHFADSGLTHLDISLRTTLLPVAAGPLLASFTVDAHWVRGLDAETTRLGFRMSGTRDRTRLWWGLGLRVTVPRCRPERELCRDL